MPAVVCHKSSRRYRSQNPAYPPILKFCRWGEEAAQGFPARASAASQGRVRDVAALAACLVAANAVPAVVEPESGEMALDGNSRSIDC